MSAAATDTIGSLVIDLRANVAKLQADMGEVKNIITKSSAQMSSQMRQDMAETRQVLALMRDDFGIGIPRELRKAVASVEGLRTVVLTLSNAFYALAFVNLGVEAFKKIYEFVDGAGKAAAEEAAHTREIATEAQKIVKATEDRRYALELIGKGEEQRHALETAHFEKEMHDAGIRLTMDRAELAAKMAIITLSLQTDYYDPGTGQAMGKTGQEDTSDYGRSMKESLMKQFDEENKAKLQEIVDLQKQIEDAMKGRKESDDKLFLYEQGLNMARVKNAEAVAVQDVELKKDTVQKMYEAGRIGLEEELMAERTAATQRYNIQLNALNQTLAILQQDPSRNKEKIEQVQTQRTLLERNRQKEMTDIYYKGVQDRKKLAQEEIAMNAEVERALLGSNKLDKLPGGLAIGLSSGAPRFQADFIGAEFDRFVKDKNAQDKLLTKSMQDLIQPADEYRLIQREINSLLADPRFKNSPETIKALKAQLLLANPEFQKLHEASAEFGKDLSDELGKLITQSESFSDFLKNIAKDIEQIALKALLLKPLEDFFSGGKSGTGGIFGLLGSLFGGSHAYGGTAAAGQISVVGENGPELIMPQSNSTVIPNSSLGGVTNVFNIDARGAAPGTELAIMRGINKAMEQNRQAAIAGMIEYQRRR